jgi:phosphatidylserine/phosphatidylglycerophosphate/cardiolipin synthase-like enzyme
MNTRLRSACLCAAFAVLSCGVASIGAGCSATTSVNASNGEDAAVPVDEAGPGDDADVGDDAGPIVRSCDPMTARAPAPQLLIGPTQFESNIDKLIAAEQTSIDVLIYEIDTKSIIDALVAAKKRGVKVRLVIDRNESAPAKATLKGAGIEVHDSSPAFTYQHAKTMLFGSQAKALVLSGNLNDYTMNGERNYAVIDTDRQDVEQLHALFERDWNDKGDVDVSCTKLIIAPLNAKERTIALINSAKKTLDLSVMYVTEKDTVAAIKAQAAAGVAVRVLLADPKWIANNPDTATELAAAKIPVKYFKALDLHAKLVIADSASLIGSENLSYNSLTQNREVGVISTEEPVVTGVEAQFEKDWSAGVAP